MTINKWTLQRNCNVRLKTMINTNWSRMSNVRRWRSFCTCLDQWRFTTSCMVEALRPATLSPSSSSSFGVPDGRRWTDYCNALWLLVTYTVRLCLKNAPTLMMSIFKGRGQNLLNCKASEHLRKLCPCLILRARLTAVSYTHLTLPTNREV